MDVEYIDYKGIKVTLISKTIVDMLEKETTDVQILYETFAHYYFSNPNSYKGLYISKKLEKKQIILKKKGQRYFRFLIWLFRIILLIYKKLKKY